MHGEEVSWASCLRELLKRSSASAKNRPAITDDDGVDMRKLGEPLAVDGRDRKRLERLCRYIARPPLSLDRLEEHLAAFDSRGRGKTAHTRYSLTRSTLSAVCVHLIPLPRFHMLRYHGVGHSRDRAEVVPQELAKDESSLEPSTDAQQLLFEPTPPLQPPPPPSRHPWA